MIVHKKAIYRCDICGKESEWMRGEWFSIMYAFGAIRIGGGWEHDFHVCSKPCETKLSDMSKKERHNLALKILKHGQ